MLREQTQAGRIARNAPNCRPKSLTVAFLLAVTLPLLSRPSIAQDGLVQVIGVRFAKMVIKKKPEGWYNRTAPANRPLFFWTNLKGSKNAYKKLVEKCKLPIKHVWIWYAVSGTQPLLEVGEPIQELQEKDIRATDPIALGVGTSNDEKCADPEKLKKLRAEMNANEDGSFDWRTWSKKAKIREGVWRVELRYFDDTFITCGARQQPCRFDILIR